MEQFTTSTKVFDEAINAMTHIYAWVEHNFRFSIFWNFEGLVIIETQMLYVVNTVTKHYYMDLETFLDLEKVPWDFGRQKVLMALIDGTTGEIKTRG